MRARSGPTIEHRMIAAKLRLLRERAHLSLAEAGERAGVHPATLSRAESAIGVPRQQRVSLLLEIYQAPAEARREILDLLEAAGWDGWWHGYRGVMPEWLQETVGLETHASLIRSWSPGVVPELLRTPEYAYALHRRFHPGDSAARAHRAVELLEQRQERLRRPERPGGPCAVWILSTSAALSAEVGGAGVTTRQRQHLADLLTQPWLTLQVLPAEAPPHPLSDCGAIRILRIPVTEIPDVLLRGAVHGADITDDPEQVARHRQALDAACVAAPRAGSLPPLNPGG